MTFKDFNDLLAKHDCMALMEKSKGYIPKDIWQLVITDSIYDKIYFKVTSDFDNFPEVAEKLYEGLYFGLMKNIKKDSNEN